MSLFGEQEIPGADPPGQPFQRHAQTAQPGLAVRFNCDGCNGPLSATITRVANQPEYTPPVIYSQSARAKLVFRVEAKPDQGALLRPGLPIDVEPLR